MTDYDELKEWYDKADDIRSSLTEDRVYNMMIIAVMLRETYLRGKKDGIHEWNNAQR